MERNDAGQSSSNHTDPPSQCQRPFKRGLPKPSKAHIVFLLQLHHQVRLRVGAARQGVPFLLELLQQPERALSFYLLAETYEAKKSLSNLSKHTLLFCKPEHHYGAVDLSTKTTYRFDRTVSLETSVCAICDLPIARSACLLELLAGHFDSLYSPGIDSDRARHTNAENKLSSWSSSRRVANVMFLQR